MGKLRAVLTGVLIIFCVCLVSTFAVDYMTNDMSLVKALLISVIASMLMLPFFLSTGTEDGCIVVDEADDRSLRFTIECNEDPEEWVDKDYITLSVKRKETEED